jgi:hypothetical protein
MHVAACLSEITIAVFLKMFTTTQYARQHPVCVIVITSPSTNRIGRSAFRVTLKNVHEDAICERNGPMQLATKNKAPLQK